MTTQFDDLAALYEEFSALAFRQHLEFPTVLGLVAEHESQRVLDLGCGSGIYSRLLRGQGITHVTGIDESPGMIEYARRREQKERCGIDYIVGSLPDRLRGTFDLVLAVYVLPYATTYAELVSLCQTASDALRPNGRFLALAIHPSFDPNPECYARYGFRLHTKVGCEDAAPIGLELRFGGHHVNITARYWSTATLLRALTETGFAAPRWRKHRLSKEAAAGARDFWTAYLSTPHAAIMDADKEGGTS
ncbi:class I SAM-dependent methyltransferase [Streptomyces spectabilis]|uniref:SAM-dependent methyltransferase n=1 Tax=Streptomyces spectabilis TaxID=68270 RepID=A0A7W8B478_STRST|nr:class I SAM-dependent methyltransferase [Streptomyces spectabilis]MBB5110055.1 SAM-dependent methyltransferase [Streptomyces spectabilis]GGV57734.1 hypothetical protein GCM10010245_90840 [Streptomyces spectabilis]